METGVWGDWPSGLRCCDQNWRVAVQTLLGARPGLGTQPCYEAPGDLCFEYVKCKWLTLGEWGCFLNKGPKLGVDSQIAVKKM